MLDIKFDRVSKKYRIPSASRRGADRLSLLTRRLQGPRGDFWALKDVSFSVRRGETLGIIGPNGASKSTILKWLSKITAPTGGEITISGRLSALIEVGSGFHAELTGREDVFLSGSILGMRRREIAQKLESIVEFAGVRQFFDTPIKHYYGNKLVKNLRSRASARQWKLLFAETCVLIRHYPRGLKTKLQARIMCLAASSIAAPRNKRAREENSAAKSRLSLPSQEIKYETRS